MTLNFIVQTIIEIIMMAIIIIGFIFEPKIAEWEQKQFKKLKDRKKVNK